MRIAYLRIKMKLDEDNTLRYLAFLVLDTAEYFVAEIVYYGCQFVQIQIMESLEL